MTAEQKQFVENLTEAQAGKLHYDLLKKKEWGKAHQFWKAWEELHPDSVNRQDTVAIAADAWSSQDYVERDSMVNTVQYAVSQGMEPVAQFKAPQSNAMIKNLSLVEMAIYNLLQDGEQHNRNEILEVVSKHGGKNNIDFRKHISNIRAALEAIESPYTIPKNKSFQEGNYQLIHK